MTIIWLKTFHLVFVIGWMAALFYLPRILVNIVEVGDVPVVRERLLLMGQRLSRFGQMMFGLAFVLGFVLWWMRGFSGAFMHPKLALVALLLAYSVWMGRLLRRAAQGGTLPSARGLRLLNELPLLALVPILWLVLAKPF